MIRVVGIDPGTRIAGFGIVDLLGRDVRAVTAGAWNLKGDLPLAARLAELSRSFKKLLDEYKPTHVCIELAFVGENVRSALFLGHARGVILAESYERGLPISELSATTVKKRLTNYGRADKESVARMIGLALNISTETFSSDATDALAIAHALAMELKTDSHSSQCVEINKERADVLLAWKQGFRK